MNNSTWELIAFCLYFVAMIGVGFVFYKKTNTLSDFILGDRSMGPFVSAISAVASDMSGWMLMGLPGAVYLAGMNQLWIGIGLALGTYISWLVVAKRLRNYSVVAGNALTIPEFLQNRFHDRSGVLRLVSGIVILVMFTIYVASSLSAGGTLFVTLFPSLAYQTAVVITAIIIIFYTFLGGFKAVCWTDLFQGMLMLIAAVAVPVFALGLVSGEDVSAKLASMDLGAGFLNLMQNQDGSPYTFTSLISNLAWGLGYLGMPHILVRFMAVREAREIKVSRRIATGWVVIALGAVTAVGIVGRLVLGSALADAGSQETVFIVLTRQVFSAAPFLVGILLSAILAAAMSTADSQLLVVSSTITNDLYSKMTKKEISQKKLVWISRGAVAVIAVIAAAIALDENSTIMSLVSNAWSGFGATFGPVILMSLIWKRTNKAGAAAGMIVGAAVWFVWTQFFAGTGLYEMVPAFLASLAALVIVSLATKKPAQEIQDEFEQVKAMH